MEITLDDKLKFDKHVENICKKASKKLNALARVTNYMQLPKRRILMNAFFKAQFNYCPAVWMFHNSSLKSKISRFHERYLGLSIMINIQILRNCFSKIILSPYITIIFTHLQLKCTKLLMACLQK